jgi:hypothetical protein
VLEKHLQADADAEKGFSAAARSTASRRPRASKFAHAVRHRALTGKHHASAAPTTAGSAVTITCLPPATCSSAFDTERRLPMP